MTENSADLEIVEVESPESDRALIQNVSRKRSFTPERIVAPAANALARSMVTVRLLWIAVVVLAVGHMIVPILLVSVLSKPEKVALLDGTESLMIANLMPLDEAKEIQDSIAYSAAKALLDRNPEGFDAPDSLHRLFSSELVQRTEGEFVKQQKEQYEKKQLHQKLEISKIELQKLQGNLILATVYGQVITVADVGEESVTEPAWVRLNLKLARNPFLGRNKRYPYMVVDYWFGTPEKLKSTTVPHDE